MWSGARSRALRAGLPSNPRATAGASWRALLRRGGAGLVGRRPPLEHVVVGTWSPTSNRMLFVHLLHLSAQNVADRLSAGLKFTIRTKTGIKTKFSYVCFRLSSTTVDTFQLQYMRFRRSCCCATFRSCATRRNQGKRRPIWLLPGSAQTAATKRPSVSDHDRPSGATAPLM